MHYLHQRFSHRSARSKVMLGFQQSSNPLHFLGQNFPNF
jgi:hypothetical protein